MLVNKLSPISRFIFSVNTFLQKQEEVKFYPGGRHSHPGKTGRHPIENRHSDPELMSKYGHSKEKIARTERAGYGHFPGEAKQKAIKERLDKPSEERIKDDFKDLMELASHEVIDNDDDRMALFAVNKVVRSGQPLDEKGQYIVNRLIGKYSKDLRDLKQERLEGERLSREKEEEKIELPEEEEYEPTEDADEEDARRQQTLEDFPSDEEEPYQPDEEDLEQYLQTARRRAI